MTQRPLRVTVLGSCRVYDPFKLLADDGRIELRNRGVYGYVHTAREAVQQLAVMHDELTIPPELYPFIFKDGSAAAGRYNLSETDLLVVEISSIKEMVVAGYHLQINRVREILLNDAPVPVKAAIWEALEADPEQFIGPETGLVEAEIIRSLRLNVQGKASMLADMRSIVDRFGGPVLFVSHFDTLTPKTNQPIPMRQRLVRYVSDNAAELGQPFFNPRDLIETYGRDRALLDSAHYAPEFISPLAECLYGRFVAAPLPSR